MSKTYILQKDITSPLLSVKAGEPVRKEEGIEYYSIGGKEYYFESKYVENNPEWFLPEEKNEYKANFLWGFPDHSVEAIGYEFANAKTEEYQKDCWDTLVKRIQENKSNDSFQFAEWASHSDWTYLPSKQKWHNEEDEENITPLTTEELFQKFKQSHTPKPQAEKHWMGSPSMADLKRMGKNKPYQYVDFSKDPSGIIKGSDIPVSATINITKDDLYQKNKPDWEIVALRNTYDHNKENVCSDSGTIFRYNNGDHATKMCHEIHSVKRLSDGEVFSVGDEIQQGKITYIGIGQHGLDIDTCKEDKYHNRHVLWQLKKLPPQPQKLFGHIKQAIEQVLNDDVDGLIQKELDGVFYLMGKKLYTQQQVEVIRKEAFLAARKTYPGSCCLLHNNYDDFCSQNSINSTLTT